MINNELINECANSLVSHLMQNAFYPFIKKKKKSIFFTLSVSRYCLLKSAAAAVRAAFTVDLLITFNCF